MLQRIRKLKNKVEVIDLGHGYYVGRFPNPNEYFLALAGGPWFMFQYHFSIQQWVPNFRKKTQYNNKMFIWAQFKNLPIEYFNGDALFKLAQAIGRPIKMDYHTSEVTRGRYARVCIEVDTNIPLPPYVRINSIKQEIAYELNAVFCNKCGKIGHFSIKCQASSITEGIIECPLEKLETQSEWNIIEKRRISGVAKTINNKPNRSNKEFTTTSNMRKVASDSVHANYPGMKNLSQWKTKK